MKHEVPQFIDVKDKVIGPLTFEQFLYILGGAGLGYLSNRFIMAPFGFLLGASALGLGLLLAFYKVNNRPFIDFLAAFISFQTRGRTYIWQKDPYDARKKPLSTQPIIKEPVEKRYDITTIAQGLDVLDRSHEYEHKNTTIR